MPLTDFASLPDDARTWIFGASHPISADAETDLLNSVDAWLDEWAAHGVPLTCAREWIHGRFLVVGVDQRAAGASGCSVDALFRVLQQVQGTHGTSFLGGSRVFFRNEEGQLTCVERAAFGAAPGVTMETLVYDTALTTAGEYRRRFEVPVGESWHAALRNTR
jgi:hypothetical protein